MSDIFRWFLRVGKIYSPIIAESKDPAPTTLDQAEDEIVALVNSKGFNHNPAICYVTVYRNGLEVYDVNVADWFYPRVR